MKNKEETAKEKEAIYEALNFIDKMRSLGMKLGSDLDKGLLEQAKQLQELEEKK